MPFNTKRFNALMLSKNLTFNNIADRLGLNRSTVSRWRDEKNTHNITIERVELLAAAVGCQPAYLTDWSDEQHGTIILTSDERDLIDKYRRLLASEKKTIADVINLKCGSQR